MSSDGISLEAATKLLAETLVKYFKYLEGKLHTFYAWKCVGVSSVPPLIGWYSSYMTVGCSVDEKNR